MGLIVYFCGDREHPKVINVTKGLVSNEKLYMVAVRLYDTHLWPQSQKRLHPLKIINITIGLYFSICLTIR